MQAYPVRDGKVIYAEIDDGESYTILTNTIGSRRIPPTWRLRRTAQT